MRLSAWSFTRLSQIATAVAHFHWLTPYPMRILTPSVLFVASLLGSPLASAQVDKQAPGTPAHVPLVSIPQTTSAPALAPEVATPLPATTTPPGVAAKPSPVSADEVAPPPAESSAPASTDAGPVVASPVAATTGTAPGTASATPTPVAEVEPAAAEPAPEPGPVVKAQFGKGVTIGTSDEIFTLNIRARMQIQAAYYDHHDEAVDDVTQMQVRRARVVFQGNVLGPDLTYYLQLAFSNRDTEADVRLPLRDAYFTYAPHASANFRFGQMKVPYGRQRVVSSSAQGMVDRSIVVAELNLDRDVGAQMFSKDLFGLNEKLGYALGVFGGDGRNRVATNAGYLYIGRLVLTPFGSFDELVEADIGREDRPRLSIAASAVRNQATNRPQSTLGTPYADSTVFFDYTHFGADFMFKYKGFFATGEWMLRKADDSIVGVEDEAGEVTDFYSRDAWGAYVQLGQMLTDKFEVSARYGHLNPLTETDPKLSLTHELGGGVSYYFDQHNLKVQGDYFYYAKNNDLKDGDHQVRIQSQLYF